MVLSPLVLWGLNGIICVVTVFTVYFYGRAVASVGTIEMSPAFVLKLALNLFFVLAVASSLVNSMLTIGIFSTLGVAKGKFFLETTAIATIVSAVAFNSEKIHPIQYLWIAVIIIGSVMLTND